VKTVKIKLMGLKDMPLDKEPETTLHGLK
jgi:hypothetical protein